MAVDRKQLSALRDFRGHPKRSLENSSAETNLEHRNPHWKVLGGGILETWLKITLLIFY